MSRITQFLKAIHTIFFKDSLAKELEVLALRQQLANFKAKKQNPEINNFDRFFWILLKTFWPNWKSALVVVEPKTVISWHRKGFKLFWKIKSKAKRGRPNVDSEIRSLILKMQSENGWGAPQIHGQLLKLGFDICESSVSKYLPKSPSTERQRQSWETFLKNHMHNTVSMDFISVPTVTFRLLYCLIFFDHKRRKVIHFNVTTSPSSEWIVQQMREAFPFEQKYKYLIRDNDKKYGKIVKDFIKSCGLIDTPTAFRCPWQNPFCERMNGTLRHEILDQVIIFNERHLTWILSLYLNYYHSDRTHIGLDKDSPNGRAVTRKPSVEPKVISIKRVGGLYRRYEWENAA